MRSIDIANELGFTKPSVSVEAMKNLRENGYAKTDEDGMITLTDKAVKSQKPSTSGTLFCPIGWRRWG